MSDRQTYEQLADQRDDLAGRLRDVANELETERMRLAACSTAALGYFNGCIDEYKSASLADVLNLHQQFTSLRAQVEELQRQLSAYEEAAKQKPVVWYRKEALGSDQFTWDVFYETKCYEDLKPLFAHHINLPAIIKQAKAEEHGEIKRHVQRMIDALPVYDGEYGEEASNKADALEQVLGVLDAILARKP